MAEPMQARELRGWVGCGEASIPDDREDRLLPWRSVRDITGLSRTTAWRLQQTGDFPNPVPISANRVGWWESELTAWKATRRIKSQPRPRPYPPSTVMREAASVQTSRKAVKVMETAAPKTVAHVEPVRAARRRGRPRVVSPDQIDFGF